MSLTSSTCFCAVYLPFFLRYGNILLGDWCLVFQYSMVVSSPRVRMSSTNHSVTWHRVQGQWRPKIHCGEVVKKIAFLYYSGYYKCKCTPPLTVALHSSIGNRVKLKLHWHDSGRSWTPHLLLIKLIYAG